MKLHSKDWKRNEGYVSRYLRVKVESGLDRVKHAGSYGRHIGTVAIDPLTLPMTSRARWYPPGLSPPKNT